MGAIFQKKKMSSHDSSFKYASFRIMVDEFRDGCNCTKPIFLVLHPLILSLLGKMFTISQTKIHTISFLTLLQQNDLKNSVE
jgi:hypothetical protein